MMVTDIAPTKRGRYGVFVDGEFYCSLHADFAYKLSIGGEVLPEVLDALYRESQYRITRERALKLLGQRAYTEQGLYEKLLSYTDEQSASAAVARMIELGLLNDADYARRFASDCVNLKGFSPGRTAVELKRKGISAEIIGETLAELENDPGPAIARIVLRKYPRWFTDEKNRAKMVNALLRLGYGYGDIAAVLRNLEDDENYYENPG